MGGGAMLALGIGKVHGSADSYLPILASDPKRSSWWAALALAALHAGSYPPHIHIFEIAAR